MPKNRIAYYASIALLVLATLGGEFVYGRFSGGARQQELLEAAAGRVATLPDAFGPWRSEKDLPLEDSALAMLKCSGYVSRAYAHQDTGEVVTLVVLAGRPGPLVAHTPAICFSTHDYEIATNPARRAFRSAAAAGAARRDPSKKDSQGAAEDELFQMSFQARSLRGERLEIYYGWAPPAGGWRAPDQPRLALGGQPALYKLQVGSRLSGPAASAGASDARATGSETGPEQATANACRRFLVDALPEVNRLLFGPATSGQDLPATP